MANYSFFLGQGGGNGGCGDGGYAIIKIEYPSGSQVTVTHGGSTVNAPDTSGVWVYGCEEGGTYAISLVGTTVSKSVSITTKGQIEFVYVSPQVINYALIYHLGDEFTNVAGTAKAQYAISTGGWEYSVPVSDAFGTTLLNIDTGNFKKMFWLVGMGLLCLALFALIDARKVNVSSRPDNYDPSAGANHVIALSSPTPEPIQDPWPDIDINLPQYAMVNESRLLASSYVPDVTKIEGSWNMMFDTAAYPHLEAMIQDLKDNGFGVYVGGAYRSYSYQKQRFDGKCYNIALEMGIEGKEIWLLPEYQEAVEEAKKYVMVPGSSEHQLGLAVDLYDKQYVALQYERMNQNFYQYLDSICANYGFIKRYPTRKLLLTGWDEPWHYRYVGVEAATFIMNNNLCYEEFYAHYVPDFEY